MIDKLIVVLIQIQSTSNLTSLPTSESGPMFRFRHLALKILQPVFSFLEKTIHVRQCDSTEALNSYQALMVNQHVKGTFPFSTTKQGQAVTAAYAKFVCTRLEIPLDWMVLVGPRNHVHRQDDANLSTKQVHQNRYALAIALTFKKSQCIGECPTNYPHLFSW